MWYLIKNALMGVFVHKILKIVMFSVSLTFYESVKIHIPKMFGLGH